MSFATVRVELPDPPAGPSPEEEELCFVLEGLRSSPVVRHKVLHPGSPHPAGRGATVALAAARQRLEALERYGAAVCEAVGRAWLDAGAPGSPGLKATVDQRLDRAREAWRQRYQALMTSREATLQATERRDDAIRDEDARVRRSIARLDLVLELVERAEILLADEGSLRAFDLIDALPDALRRDAPRGNVTELARWLARLRSRFVLEREEAHLEDQKLQTRRLRNLRAGVGADTEILGGVRALDAARDEQQTALSRYLMELGDNLLPHVASFANGQEADARLRAVRELHRATAERVSSLEALLTELGVADG